MIVLNLFAGPGTGKSTAAAGIFSAMKKKNINCELVHEYAKELTYGEDNVRLGDQFIISAQQNHKLRKLERAGVEYGIADSPLVMGITYYQDDKHVPQNEYIKFILSVFNSYDNINIFLNRNPNNIYKNEGRNQTLEQAIEKDNEIKELLDFHKMPYFEIDISDTTEEEILNILEDII